MKIRNVPKVTVEKVGVVFRAPLKVVTLKASLVSLPKREFSGMVK